MIFRENKERETGVVQRERVTAPQGYSTRCRQSRVYNVNTGGSPAFQTGLSPLERMFLHMVNRLCTHVYVHVYAGTFMCLHEYVHTLYTLAFLYRLPW